MKAYKVLLVAGVLGLLGVLFVYLFVVNKSHTNVEKTKAVYEGSAESLYAAFDTNPQDAASRYVDQVVQVSGTIFATGGSGEHITLEIEAGNPMGGGLAAVLAPDQAAKAASLQPGDAVTLRGLCSGSDAGGDGGGLLDALGSTVQLTACVLLP